MDYDFPETVGNVIIPLDELIFFRGVGIPPTRYVYVHTLTSVNTKTPRFYSQLWLQGMWGHATSCGCPLCQSLGRVFRLIVLGQGRASFCSYALSAIRSFEAELRDELARGEPAHSQVIPGEAAPPAEPAREEKTSQHLLPEQEPPAPLQREQKGSQAPPLQREQKGSQAPVEGPSRTEGVLNLTPKVPPPVPPTQLSSAPSGSKAEVKEEAKRTSPRLPSERRSEKKERGERARSSGRRRHRESRDRRRGEERSPKQGRSRQREKRSRDSEKKRRRRDSKEPIEEERGREKKRRSEKPPEPLGPPPQRREFERWWPQEPRYPPPQRQGRGWQGELPVSSHPRWTESTNKGQVKRGKQELFSRRHRRR